MQELFFSDRCYAQQIEEFEPHVAYLVGTMDPKEICDMCTLEKKWGREKLSVPWKPI